VNAIVRRIELGGRVRDTRGGEAIPLVEQTKPHDVLLKLDRVKRKGYHARERVDPIKPIPKRGRQGNHLFAEHFGFEVLGTLGKQKGNFPNLGLAVYQAKGGLPRGRRL